ncbi:HAD-superfamily phosphatase, subfamily IIIC/FkbH-like domain-containing protein [Hydrobacter penzbergensis]|uniref:HAD-superfamily phosphatase, subfamily IIIC/FkbH-like domain-containing protein n=1 Tax=Hydrobacter penzbergensis TaxID=1235997 RepID=A0A8X8IGZ1_9BACT|nr:HAD-IIIC family phosphatase [Hydrobacter penzbergensis]SDW86347.1 HAD-superfamily phosphatase, subfamily IIIC/FkbH-like domain-containing protein [Hydrobacter penzbergensis]
MKTMNLSDIIRRNAELGEQLLNKEIIPLKVLANISINQLKPTLEYSLRSHTLNAHVTFGDYDNIIQESAAIDTLSIPIIFWELSNLKESFVYEIETENESYFQNYFDKITTELKMVFANLSKSKLVLFNKFSHLFFSCNSLKPTIFEQFVDKLNDFLIEYAPSNFFLIEINKVLARVSIEQAVDSRGFYLSKTLYSITFTKIYSEYISPIILSIYSKSKKAIIFDCDNTLWKGVVGEDGVEGIALSSANKNGIYYKEVHLIAKALAKKGVIIGICSKNNLEDVVEVLEKRKDSSLTESDIVIKKVNWIDKATNLLDISKELNIGIDSIVFVDDSEFEVSLVNAKLPEVKTLTVPQKTFEYPQTISKNLDLFFTLNVSEEDKNRVKMYQQNLERGKEVKSYQNIDDYLASLNIELILSNKSKTFFERLVQLTQKTNQFNLTTKRYTNADMHYFYNSTEFDIFSLDVNDKYGNSGITGLCIIRYNERNAEIDTFLMSCRILGRNIEKVFLSEILKQIKLKEIDTVKAEYNKTHKNSLVEPFFEENGFELIEKSDDKKEYLFDFSKHSLNENINYIKVIWNQELKR